VGRRGPELADLLGGGTSWQHDCSTFVSGFDMPDAEFADAWKSALLLLAGAGVLLTFSEFSALASICVQSIFGKSIFTVTGLIQSIAGILYASL